MKKIKKILMPLAFELGSGFDSWSSLARAVIGGLTTSTVLTLLIVPIMFILLNTLAEKIKKKLTLST
jgi:HAE1 family hydrophobic/amphiphilic exporter-1